MDNTSSKLLTYKVRSEKNDPLNRLISVTDIDLDHNDMSQLGFDDRGVLWTITFNSAKDASDHFFQSKLVSGSRISDNIRINIINSFN